MLLRFAYSKLIRPNQQTFSPGTAITTHIDDQSAIIEPIGGAGTAAPSTMIYDSYSKNRYFLNKPYSAINAALSAVTSTSQYLDLL